MFSSKSDLRREMSARRAALPAAEVARLGRDFAAGLERLPEWRAARLPCAYVSFGGEASTREILRGAFAAGREVVAPRAAGESLRLFRIRGFGDLQPGRFGIEEPASGCPEVDPAAVDFFVIPGLAFDRRGCRVGFGKGYYDRLLAGVREDVPLVALAYGFQVVARVAHESHDRPVGVLVTPEGVIRCATE